MKKNSGKINSQIVKLTRTALSLLFLTILLLITFINYQVYKNSSPYDVIVSDIKPNSVNISWKTLKEVPTYIRIDNEKKLFGDGVPSKFHQTNINDLKELTEYEFVITDGNTEWKKILLPNSNEVKNIVRENFFFITTKTPEEISLPQLIEITSNPEEMLYVSLHNIRTGMDSKIKSIKTNQFGSALIDKKFFNLNWKDDEYLINIHPAISLNPNISQSISVYASEINCNQNAPEQTIDGVTREQFANYATRWVNGRGKNYAYECFNDVVYRSKLAGIDPAFSLAVWLNESSASNYTQNLKQYGHIEDFGIHGLSSVPPQDFNSQITHFLKMSHKSFCPGLTSWESWGNIYRFGTCNTNDSYQRSLGIDYYKKTENLYRWITNGRGLPSSVSGLPIPVDVGHDSGNWSPKSKPVCCFAKFKESDILKGFYNNDITELTCEEVWTQSTIQDIESFLHIENIEQNECEEEFTSSCCRVGNEIQWYPTKYCQYVIKDIDSSFECKEYIQKKACFYRNERFQWLPEGIGEDSVINIESEKQCNLRNDVSQYIVKLNKGNNFIGFDFTPSYNHDVLYASRLMSLYPQISLIGNFQDNEWTHLISKSESSPFLGQDFYFEQSKGYLFILDQDITINISGWINSEALTPTLDKGWNFVLSQSVSSDDNNLKYQDVLGVNTQEDKYKAVFILKK